MTTKTQDDKSRATSGAKRAAARLMEEDHEFYVECVTTTDQNAESDRVEAMIAAIIDRETAVPELYAALKDIATIYTGAEEAGKIARAALALADGAK